MHNYHCYVSVENMIYYSLVPMLIVEHLHSGLPPRHLSANRHQMVAVSQLSNDIEHLSFLSAGRCACDMFLSKGQVFW